LLDLSRRGFGLLVSVPVSLETVLEVEIEGWPGRPLLMLVRHVTPQDGGWRCGGSLFLPLSDGELQTLLALVREREGCGQGTGGV
jgi:hypothetical protein